METKKYEQMLFGFGTYAPVDEVEFFNISGQKKFRVGDNVESIRIYHLSGIVSVKIGETIRYFRCDFAAKSNFKEKGAGGDNLLKFAEDEKDVKGIEKCFGAVQEI